MESIIDLISGLLNSVGVNTTGGANFGNPFTIFFGGGFTCAGLLLMFYVAFLLFKAVNAMLWPTAPGVVVSARIDSHVDSEGTSHSAVIVYQYQVGAQAYQNDLLAFGAKNYSGGYFDAEKTLKKYPVGAGVRVRYNPGNPQNSVLEVRAAGAPLLMFVAVILVVVGIVGGVIGAFRA